jgi:peptidoglycan/xylan/chitin deacetylase (PgdA/CDA1 family)
MLASQASAAPGGPALECLNSRVTITGTEGPDRILGTTGNDVIAGLGGDDHIEARGGNDVVCGGAGRDRLIGGAGADVLIGGPDPDFLSGEGGADTVVGGGGDDMLHGGSAGDRIAGGDGADTIRGGPGPDILSGGDGHDDLSGGAGDDALAGGRGGDLIQGGIGADLLFGEGGNDILLGREGADTCDGGDHTDTAGGCEKVIATERGQVPPPRFRPDSGQVALTFDDGPLPVYTPLILDTLERYGVPATFFVTGRSAAQHPGLLRRMEAEGHSVQNHTWDHAWLTRYSDSGVRSQLSQADAAIAAGTGVEPACMRPPFGAMNDRVRGIVEGLGLEIVMWDVDPQDWRYSGSRYVASHVTRYTSGGDIVLLHDGGGYGTIGALPEIIREMRARGLEFVTLCE